MPAAIPLFIIVLVPVCGSEAIAVSIQVSLYERLRERLIELSLMPIFPTHHQQIHIQGADDSHARDYFDLVHGHLLPSGFLVLQSL